MIISDNGFWTRWNDCDCITSDCIGKSSIFALHLEQNDSLVELVTKFQVWRHYSNLDISFGFIEVTKHRTVKLPSDHFPFDIIYALQSIQSVSYTFQDDLTINNQID